MGAVNKNNKSRWTRSKRRWQRFERSWKLQREDPRKLKTNFQQHNRSLEKPTMKLRDWRRNSAAWRKNSKHRRRSWPRCLLAWLKLRSRRTKARELVEFWRIAVNPRTIVC